MVAIGSSASVKRLSTKNADQLLVDLHQVAQRLLDERDVEVTGVLGGLHRLGHLGEAVDEVAERDVAELAQLGELDVRCGEAVAEVGVVERRCARPCR